MRLDLTDTIVAISTAAGENGIGIVRMSGPKALETADKIFISKRGKRPSTFKSHTVHYGRIADSGRIIDEVLLNIMRAPATYTREDIVEINCHGGIVVLKKVLDLVVSLGCRMAEPGEFTKRAFLNGRIDLMQAEAVFDIISSRTDDSLRLAQRQLKGETSQKIRQVKAALVDAIADIEADINFPDEELGVSKASFLKDSLSEAKEALSAFIESSDNGIVLREGVTTVICGRPNVGKSSLMNSFLKEDRVIVTPIPGTTRDSIEEIVNVRGIPLRIVDTAGIINAEDEPTKEGVRKSRHYMDIADLILLVLDSSDKLNKQDMDVIDAIKDKKTIVVVNKTDLPAVLPIDEVKERLHNKKIIKVSAKKKSGLEELKKAIYDMFWSGEITSENIFVSNSRHIEAIRKALDFIRGAISGLNENRPWEFVSVDIKDAVMALGVITGEAFTEELLDAIFGKFCIGK